MNDFRHILVLLNTEHSGQVCLNRIRRFVSDQKPTVTLLDVQPQISSFLPFFNANHEAVDRMVEERRRRIGEFAKELADVTTVEQKVLVGDRHVVTIREAIRGNYDLVLKDARPGRIAFGSTDQRLFRDCPVPVWVLRPDEPANYKRVMVSIDPISEGSQATVGPLLDIASKLATFDNAELDVVHAWRMPGEEMLRYGMIHMQEEELQDALSDVEKEHKRAMAEAIKPYEGKAPTINTHLIKGEPGPTIAAFAKERDVDVIVMGTVGRRGIAGWIIGNTAETVLQEVDCSVLAIKPEGFKSPVHAD